ncbi:MAG: 23S rRNA (guanosine(2251)-2'-O)-methyltransferase RlmB [Planctomycetes bacterium]|jgi:23S rRNA (guanosine2251-2'-O)-methyltransferase|nr:23S rRNA (guanosine(2251)-2'-O)-methyltransferase RlmB [Planctomycetota bacterium]
MARETVYGFHPVRELLRRGTRPVHDLLVARSPKDAEVKDLLALARARGVPARFVAKEDVERRAPGGIHQGFAAETDEFPMLVVDEALAAFPPGPAGLWVGLDGITDPHNMGAILRSAAAFGAGALLVTERRSAQLTPLVQKVASGAAEYVPVVDAGNMNQAVRRLKEAGFWIYGAALEGKSLEVVRINGPCLLLIGSEGEGLRRRTRELSDELVAIPQAPDRVGSLNASCAAAVLLYEFSRRLAMGGKP